MKPARRASFAQSSHLIIDDPVLTYKPKTPPERSPDDKKPPKPASFGTQPIFFQVGFPLDRLHLYKDIFTHLAHLKKLTQDLLAAFPRPEEPLLASASLLLERQILTELRDDLMQPITNLDRSGFFQQLSKNCSVKPLLDQISGSHPPQQAFPSPEGKSALGPLLPVPSPSGESVVQPASGANVNPQLSQTSHNSEPFSQGNGVVSSIKSVRSPLGGKSLDPCHAVPHAPATAEHGAAKSEVKTCLGVVAKMYEDKRISDPQRALLKRAIITNNRRLFSILLEPSPDPDTQFARVEDFLRKLQLSSPSGK